MHKTSSVPPPSAVTANRNCGSSILTVVLAFFGILNICPSIIAAGADAATVTTRAELLRRHEDLAAKRIKPDPTKPVQRPAMARTLVETGPHHQIRNNLPADEEAQSSPDATRTTPGDRRIVAIESGMNYWDGQQWTPSDARFAISPEGDAFVAERVQHRTRLTANINEPGAVTVSMPDGTVLRSTPVAVGLFNAVSGESVILAGIQDCVGTLVSDNQVVYEDAFNVNGVTANIVYTIEKGSFAQDIVITGYSGLTVSGHRPEFDGFYEPPYQR